MEEEQVSWKDGILRDMFANAAMQTLLDHPATKNFSPEDIAKHAYIQADAMMEARSKNE